MDISLLCSGIRTQRWPSFFESIFRNSTSMSVEIVCVGPNPLPDVLKHDCRIKYKQDLSSPTRGIQIAALMATGSRIMSLADDAVMEPGAQDAMWNIAKDQDRKTIVIGKYIEGPEKSKKRNNWKNQLSDNYYKVHGCAATASKYIPNDWSIANFAYIDREYFIELGGMDCRFESPALPTTDWAIRAQRDGAKFIQSNTKVFTLDLDRSTAGHGAIYEAFVQNDYPLYKAIYDDPNCVKRTKIDFDNWKQSPEVWDRRK